MLWYDRSLEPRVAGQWPVFEQETRRAAHGWSSLDAGSMFGDWLGSHELRDAVLEQPDELRSLLPEFEDYVTNQVATVLDVAGVDDLVAVEGQLKALGIDVDGILDFLQTDGVKKFSESFRALNESISKKLGK